MKPKERILARRSTTIKLNLANLKAVRYKHVGKRRRTLSI